MLHKLTLAGLTLVAAVSAHEKCTDALLNNQAAAKDLCLKFQQAQRPSMSSSDPHGTCPDKGAECVCTPAAPLPYPEAAAPCFQDMDYTAALQEACENVSNQSGGSTPGSQSPPSSGNEHGGTSPSQPGESGSPSPPSGPSQNQPPSGNEHGGSPPLDNNSQPGHGPVTTSSVVTTEMYVLLCVYAKLLTNIS